MNTLCNIALIIAVAIMAYAIVMNEYQLFFIAIPILAAASYKKSNDETN